MPTMTLHERAVQVVDEVSKRCGCIHDSFPCIAIVESALREVIEECAKECDEVADGFSPMGIGRAAVRSAATAIRNLKK